jgi:hypothetical protein
MGESRDSIAEVVRAIFTNWTWKDVLPMSLQRLLEYVMDVTVDNGLNACHN